MLKIDNLSFSYSYRRSPVIDDISLDIKPGCVCGLLGKNGVGKTTLLHLVAGVLTPCKGHVSYNGVNTRLRQPSTLAYMFFVPDEIVLPRIKVKDIIKANAPLYPCFSDDDMDRYMEMFSIGSDDNLRELSFGQKKKFYIGFALACNTSLVLMDEPTNGLDIPSKDAFRRLIAGAMNEERTIVISTHQARDLYQILDHVVILDRSRLILDVSTAEISRRLKFVVTDSPSVVSSAYYAVPSVGGTAVIVPNNDGEETSVDLEMLFNLSVERPYVVQSIFSNYKPVC